MSTVIDFAADFGGRDAADAVLPHWRALKRVAKEIDVPGFPLPDLTFILRVDGEVREFGFTGPAHVDVDKAGTYVSVDVGITIADREGLFDVEGNAIARGVLAAVPLLESITDPKLAGADFDTLETCLRSLCDRYLAEVAGSRSGE